MAKLGGVLVENLGQRFVDAAVPASTRFRETPSTVIDLTHGNLGGFTVEQNPKWGGEVYGVVAVSKEAYANLPESRRAETMDQAREIARGLNNPQAKPSITVKSATNQSKKF